MGVKKYIGSNFKSLCWIVLTALACLDLGMAQSRDDFNIYDDGKKQAIADFSVQGSSPQGDPKAPSPKPMGSASSRAKSSKSQTRRWKWM